MMNMKTIDIPKVLIEKVFNVAYNHDYKILYNELLKECKWVLDGRESDTIFPVEMIIENNISTYRYVLYSLIVSKNSEIYKLL